MIDQGGAVSAQRTLDAAATVVTTDNHVLNLENLNRVFQHGE